MAEFVVVNTQALKALLTGTLAASIETYLVMAQIGDFWETFTNLSLAQTSCAILCALYLYVDAARFKNVRKIRILSSPNFDGSAFTSYANH
ncbi:uncharacterized protein H6S33_010072 [Morchella sextelata]|uniref:uncharacterized protein n=1 Tax=Morchella sextelata TaxID=1174677 RepID=UPI001D0581FA|nr:uncharacterized protein H6S33_010072 [Morchella sextelata]KAH0612020.1 hypothetical protein H6S33_010072 [Morchella sextelata]